MDTAISDGDFLLDSRNRPIKIFGIDEILQQIIIKLSVHKGSFVYDKNLGSDIYSLDLTSENVNSKLFSLVTECLFDMPYVTVESVELQTSGDKKNINIGLLIYDQEESVVITL